MHRLRRHSEAPKDPSRVAERLLKVTGCAVVGEDQWGTWLTAGPYLLNRPNPRYAWLISLSPTGYVQWNWVNGPELLAEEAALAVRTDHDPYLASVIRNLRRCEGLDRCQRLAGEAGSGHKDRLLAPGCAPDLVAERPPEVMELLGISFTEGVHCRRFAAA